MNKDIYDFREDLAVRKVSLEKVIRHGLRRWKLILLAGVLLGGLFGCYKVLDGHRKKAQTQAAYSAYETQLEAYKNQQNDIRAQISSLQAKIAAREKYLNESVKMKIDPMNCPQAFAEISFSVPELDPNVKTESKAAVIKLDSIMKAYYNEMLYGVGMKHLASKYGLSETAFTELLAPYYDYYTSSFRIQVRYTDEETALLILNDVIAEMEKKSEEYKELYGDFSFTVYNKDKVTLTDIELSTYQMTKATELTQLQNAVNSAVNSLTGLTIPNPVKPYSRKQLLIDGIKLAAVGFVGGCLLMLLLLMCLGIAKGKIFTPDEIDGAYGLRNLACFAFGRNKNLPEDIDYALAQMQNVLRDKEVRKIALVGTIGEKKLGALRKAFADRQAARGEQEVQLQFTAVPGILEDAAAVRALPEHDGFILAEEVGRSNYKAVQQELRLLAETGKDVIGTVYL